MAPPVRRGSSHGHEYIPRPVFPAAVPATGHRVRGDAAGRALLISAAGCGIVRPRQPAGDRAANQPGSMGISMGIPWTAWRTGAPAGLLPAWWVPPTVPGAIPT